LEEGEELEERFSERMNHAAYFLEFIEKRWKGEKWGVGGELK
jgi:hypothetical protein